MDGARSGLRGTRGRVLAIAIGGAAGTLARAGVVEALPHRPGHWPWATFVVNLVGTLLLGWIATRSADRAGAGGLWSPLLGTGFCGALTTFSALQIETFEFSRDGDLWLAAGYPLASVAAGTVTAVAGVALARRLGP